MDSTVVELWKEAEKYGFPTGINEATRLAEKLGKEQQTALSTITSAKKGYVKKMLHAKSNAEAKSLKRYSALANYSSVRDIEDAYGWEFITEAQKDKLIALWREREEMINDNGEFEDGVTLLYDAAIKAVVDVHRDFFDYFSRQRRYRHEVEQDAERINDERNRTFEALTRGDSRDTGN